MGKKKSAIKPQEKLSGEWIRWRGGKQPVPNETLVDIIFEDGGHMDAIPAECRRWDHKLPDGCWRIVKYRRTEL